MCQVARTPLDKVLVQIHLNTVKKKRGKGDTLATNNSAVKVRVNNNRVLFSSERSCQDRLTADVIGKTHRFNSLHTDSS